jgi:hypothetical protein
MLASRLKFYPMKQAKRFPAKLASYATDAMKIEYPMSKMGGMNLSKLFILSLIC